MNVIINIPEDAKCLLKLGQKVSFDTPFLENYVMNDINIHASYKLNIAPDKIFNYLKKFVGDTFIKGDVLAEKKGLIGKTRIVSQSDGILKEINHHTGEIIISASTSEKDQVKCYFKGEIMSMDKKQLKLLVEDGHEFSGKQLTEDFGGETFYLEDTTKLILEQDMDNKIMVTESVSSYLLTKTEALGVNGFITLKSTADESSLPKAQLKIAEDFKKVFHLNLPYCLINKHYSKIYFYK